MESLDCQIARVIFSGVSRFNRAGVPFLIARTMQGGTIKGEMRKPIVGERYRLWGHHKEEVYRGEKQTAFVFDSHEVVVDQSEAGAAHYLRHHVEGIGPARALALTEHFGAETLAVLRSTPVRAAEVHGITQEIAELIGKHFAENTKVDPAAFAALHDLFAEFKVPRSVVNALLRDFGSDAPRMVREHPYRLLAFPRLGWKTVDAFAVAKVGYPKDGIERHKAAIVEGLEQLSGQGHTWGARGDVDSIALGLIGMKPTQAAWRVAEDEALVVANRIGDTWAFSLPKLAAAESTIAERLATLAALATPLPFSLPDDGLLAGQMDALRLIEAHGVVIVSGAPGTGKTYTITRTLTGLINQGVGSIRFVAPTGKAAKRAGDLIQRAMPGSPITPSTIHRALGPVPSTEAEGIPRAESKHGRGRDEFGFRHGVDEPMTGDLIVADEFSMVDIKLGASLLNAVANGSRLVIVGDPNQLPSVGPGSTLRDLIAAGVPTATLTEVQRNCGRIVAACHSILGGRVPEPAKTVDLAAGENWIHLEISNPMQIGAQVVELHRSAAANKRFDPTWDMQVISPEKRKPGIGCDHLNRELSNLLNPYKQHDPDPVKEDDAGRAPEFARGDKVIRTKNGLAQLMIPDEDGFESIANEGCCRWDGGLYGLSETDVVNGDMGTVCDVYSEGDKWFVIVQFIGPDRLCRLPYGESHLSQAYAVTCHKAQGSGFPYVIVPTHESFYYDTRTGQGLWNREMLYTLFSRAEQLLVTVGTASSIATAVGRKTVGRRKTRLAGLVARSFAPQEQAASE